MITELPRLPLTGNIDLTYRCNFRCRHCWLRVPPGVPERATELSFDEIKGIVEQARGLGCREWAISGGEPMLRPDFAEIFDYITRRSAGYALNTNGSLITPTIARLMTRKGVKMVALYGATAEVHDHVTRLPGSFEQTMRGIAYLREAGAGFVVQLIPLRDNYHQLQQMRKLAESLSPTYRIGAAWLYLTAEGDSQRNSEIRRQRLDPADVVELDRPEMGAEDGHNRAPGSRTAGDDRLYARCLDGRNEFHVDAYGGMSFCGYVKDPALRYDLRQGTVEEAWERFIPGLSDLVHGGEEYLNGCGNCDRRADCRWCPVFGYLEHRRHAARVEYLCEVAQLAHNFSEERRANCRRYYRVAGVTIRLDNDLPIEDNTFEARFQGFAVEGPGDDNMVVRQHFAVPSLAGTDLGQEVYHNPPWTIYRKNHSWIYVAHLPDGAASDPRQVMVFDEDHMRGDIYNNGEDSYRAGDHTSLMLLPTDQIILARVMADRNACILHSSAAVVEDAGLVFVGNSEAGKSTTLKLLTAAGSAHILCDDRNVVRRWPEGWRVHGTWSHGEIPIVSGDAAPLRAIFFLDKSARNRLTRLSDRGDIVRRLLACVIKPLQTADWWDKTLNTFRQVAAEVPCYEMQFDTSGGIVEQLRELARAPLVSG